MALPVFATAFSLFLLLSADNQVLSSQSISAVDSSFSRRVVRVKKPACKDRKDNDRDGKIDYPADPGCRNRKDKREKDAATPPPADGQADLGVGASLNGRAVFPADNAWNIDISAAEIDPNSDTLIASIGASTGLHPDFGTTYEGHPNGIPYVVVSGSQARSAVSFEYDDESDTGPYPIPADPPIEGGDDSDGDRHILMIDRDNWKLYELFYAYRNGSRWSAGSGAIFDLNSNALRPAGWTSADAAGLPIFPGLVRYDEVYGRGEINHALRFTASRTRRAYVSPARHFASSNTSASLPPMGMRVRLKASFDISEFSAPLQVILRAMKKHGMLLADNGSNWFVSGSPDSRWDDELLSELRAVKGSDFEVVKMGTVTTE